MLVVTRYTVPESEAPAFLAQARTALAALAARPGCLRGRVGRATDDATLWVLASEWEGVGAYRRALSAYEVKVHAVPLLSRAHDEPTAYEVIAGDNDAVAPTGLAADAGVVGVGEASGPAVATDLDRGGDR